MRIVLVTAVVSTVYESENSTCTELEIPFAMAFMVAIWGTDAEVNMPMARPPDVKTTGVISPAEVVRRTSVPSAMGTPVWLRTVTSI